jgi:hypothetical protein
MSYGANSKPLLVIDIVNFQIGTTNELKNNIVTPLIPPGYFLILVIRTGALNLFPTTKYGLNATRGKIFLSDRKRPFAAEIVKVWQI